MARRVFCRPRRLLPLDAEGFRFFDVRGGRFARPEGLSKSAGFGGGAISLSRFARLPRAEEFRCSFA